jgi:Na+-driven multidrug efflux pump
MLMLGIGPFPRLETKGAALATIFSYLTGSVLFMTIILKNKWILFKKVGQEIPFKRFLTVGYPVALTGMFFSIVYYFIAKIAASFGTDVVAAMGIGHKVEALAYFFSMGLAAGVSTFVARNLGAGREDRAKEGAVSAIRFVAVVIGVYSLIVFLFPDFFVSIFNSDPSLVKEGVSYLRVVMPAEIIQSVLIIVETGAFAGAGYTKPSFYVSLPIVFLKIPLAWYLAVILDMQGNGVWITIALSMLANGFIFMLLFRKNSWLKAKV